MYDRVSESVDRVAESDDCRSDRVGYVSESVDQRFYSAGSISESVGRIKSSVDGFQKCATDIWKCADYFQT